MLCWLLRNLCGCDCECMDNDGHINCTSCHTGNGHIIIIGIYLAIISITITLILTALMNGNALMIIINVPILGVAIYFMSYMWGTAVDAENDTTQKRKEYTEV
jgi:hypothetical protein